MPELPEVETIRRQLKEVLVGKTIQKVEVLNEKSFFGEIREIVGRKIGDVKRKAKVLEIDFENDLSVLIHLKMTGQLIYIPGSQISDLRYQKRIVGGHPTADWVNDLPSKHTRIIWLFEDGSKLFFNDLRKFGWMKVIRSQISDLRYQPGRVPDVVDKEFTVECLANVLRRSRRAVKLTILDQSLIGGMGNIYANDALYLAKVRPDKVSCDLSSDEIDNLYRAMVEVINIGIECGGASAANYVDTKGMGGTYQDHFLVYKQDGKECKRCGSKILKVKVGGRGTFYCPICQR